MSKICAFGRQGKLTGHRFFIIVDGIPLAKRGSIPNNFSKMIYAKPQFYNARISRCYSPLCENLFMALSSLLLPILVSLIRCNSPHCVTVSRLLSG